MRLFQTSPLVFWTSFFILGLTLGILNDSWIFASLLTCLGCLVLLIIYKIFSLRFHLFFAVTLILLGSLRMQMIFPVFSKVIPENQEIFAEARVDEHLRSKDVWSTNLVSIQRFYANDKWNEVDQKVVMICENSMRLLQVGDKILVKTTLNKIENKGNPGEFDAEFYWLSKGVRYQCFGFIDNIKLIDTEETGFWSNVLTIVRNYSTELIDHYVGKEQGHLLKAILLGDKSDLDVDTKSSFANAGAMHVLAVSGLHVGIIAYILKGAFQLFFSKANRNRSIIFLIVLLWFYAFITGFSASVTRAVFMYSVLIGAQVFSRNYDSLNTLSFTALVLLCWNPLYLFDIGFQLSFLAMVGIFTINPVLNKMLYIKVKWLNWLWQGTAVGLAAQVFTVPISIYYFHQFPNYFILSNIGVMLISGIVLGLGIALLLLGKIPFVNTLIGWVLFASLSGLLLFMAWIDQLPGALAVGFNPSIFWIISCYLTIIGLLIFQSKVTWFTCTVVTIPLLIILQFQRYQSLNCQEICVFNSRHSTILINSGNEQLCLYAGKEKGLKDAQRLVADYQKLHPGKVQFALINGMSNNVKQKNLKLDVTHHRFFVEWKLNDENFALVTSSRFLEEQEISQPTEILVMPFLDQCKGSSYSLKSGAWRLNLN